MGNFGVVTAPLFMFDCVESVGVGIMKGSFSTNTSAKAQQLKLNMGSIPSEQVK